MAVIALALDSRGSCLSKLTDYWKNDLRTFGIKLPYETIILLRGENTDASDFLRKSVMGEGLITG